MALCPRHDGLTVVSAAGRVPPRLVSPHPMAVGRQAATSSASEPEAPELQDRQVLVPPGPTRSRGTSGSGEVSRIAPAFRGRVSRNWAPHGRPAPCRQPAAVKVRVFHGNCQAETSPADSACACCVTAPEAMEDLPGLTGFEAHAMITNRDCDCGLVAFDQDVDRMAFAVLDRVD